LNDAIETAGQTPEKRKGANMTKTHDEKIPELVPSELEPVELNDEKFDNARLDLIRSRAAKLKAKERDLAPAQVSMAGASELKELIGAVRDLSSAVLAAAAIPALVERCGRRLDERWVSKAAIAIGAEVMRGISGKERKGKMGRPRKKGAAKK
jgi:hypothetical protein